MLFLQILLIPIKIMLKVIGYSLAAIIKLVGLIIIVLSHICGFVTNLLGGIILIAATLYTVCGIFNFGGIQHIEMWWVSSITSGILGLLLSSLELWAEALGDWVRSCGDNLSNNISCMGVLPC